MTSQYRIGIDHLLDNEIIQLVPKRIDGRALRTMSNANLLTLRNACMTAEHGYQTVAHGRRLFERTVRVDAEIARRGLDVWMSKPCEVCGETRDLEIEPVGLVGHCRCTRTLNRVLGGGE